MKPKFRKLSSLEWARLSLMIGHPHLLWCIDFGHGELCLTMSYDECFVALEVLMSNRMMSEKELANFESKVVM